MSQISHLRVPSAWSEWGSITPGSMHAVNASATPEMVARTIAIIDHTIGSLLATKKQKMKVPPISRGNVTNTRHLQRECYEYHQQRECYARPVRPEDP